MIRAIVTDVADYGEGQQIMVDFTPKGEKGRGWMVPGEYDFHLDKPLIKVGDKVVLDHAACLDGEVKAVLPADGLSPAVAWIKPDGRSDFRTLPVNNLRRRR
ncbi:MAG: hypothetical protein ABIV36_23160 [Sphingobium limneticum]